MCHIKETVKTTNDNNTVQHCIVTLVKVKHLLTTDCRCCSMKTIPTHLLEQCNLLWKCYNDYC